MWPSVLLGLFSFSWLLLSFAHILMLSNEDESLRIPYSSVFLPCFAHKGARKNKKGKRIFLKGKGGGGGQQLRRGPQRGCVIPLVDIEMGGELYIYYSSRERKRQALRSRHVTIARTDIIIYPT